MNNYIYQCPLRTRTVKLVARILKPLADEGVMSVGEEKVIIDTLRHLSRSENMPPAIPPKLLTRLEVADLLGLGLSSLKALEKKGMLGIPQRRIGSSIRYLNHHVFAFMIENDDQ